MKEIGDLRDISDYQHFNNANDVNISRFRMHFLAYRKHLIFLVIVIVSLTFTYFFRDKIVSKLYACSLVVLDSLSICLTNHGFAVDEVVIRGNKSVNSEYIRQFIDNEKSILFMSLSELRKELKASSQWIKNVSVKRLLPNVLHIEIQEYSPFANWYHDNGSSIIDDTGYVIVNDYDEQDDLISIYGNEALKGLDFIRKLVNDNNVLSSMISSVSYVDNNRWDIILSSGLHINLPKENPYDAWNSLLRIYEASNEFLIWKVVDMRVPPGISIIK
ncbi:FtsQ-type POTRA domain-containing protein [Ehrlichia sp. JZT12]